LILTRHSECLEKFEISKLLDAELTPEDITELQEAEELCRRFLSWEIDEETQDARDILMDMLEPQQEEEDGEIQYGQDDQEGQGRREQEEHGEQDEIADKMADGLQARRNHRGAGTGSDLAWRSDGEDGRWAEEGIGRSERSGTCESGAHGVIWRVQYKEV
jgi:hypothetical protein